MCTITSPETCGFHLMAPHTLRDSQNAPSAASAHIQDQASWVCEPDIAPYENSFCDMGDSERSIGYLEDAAFAAMNLYEAELTPLVDAKRCARQLAESKLADTQKLRMAIGENRRPSRNQTEQLNALRREYFEACRTTKTLARRADIAKKRAVAGLVEEAQILHYLWGHNVKPPLVGDPETAETLPSRSYANGRTMVFPHTERSKLTSPQKLATCQRQAVQAHKPTSLDARQNRAVSSKERETPQESVVETNIPKPSKLHEGDGSRITDDVSRNDRVFGHDTVARTVRTEVPPAQAPIVHEALSQRSRPETCFMETVVPVAISAPEDASLDQSRKAPSTEERQEDLDEHDLEIAAEDQYPRPFESEYHVLSSNGSMRSFKTTNHKPSSNGKPIADESCVEPPTIPIDPCKAAIDNLKRCEDECWNLKGNLEEHLGTYNTQFDEICKLDASIDPKLVKDAFGQEYNKRTRHITLLMTHAQDRLRSARVDAKHAGVVNPNSPDQTSGFFSTVEDGPKAEIAKFLIDSCDQERILDWQKAPVKAKRFQLSEYKFATSGADVETWDSLSTRGSPSKRRKIDDSSHWVRSNGQYAGVKDGRSRPRAELDGVRRRRAKSAIACDRKPRFSDLLSGDVTDYQFTFTCPVTDDSVWLKPENWDDIVMVEG